jgi:hypothetical protein
MLRHRAMLPQKRAALTAFCRPKNGFGGANGALAPPKSADPQALAGLRRGNAVFVVWQFGLKTACLAKPAGACIHAGKTGRSS